MNANGSAAHALTTNANTSKAPSWSPSGDRIAFTARFAGPVSQIWIIPSAGGTPVQVTTGALGATEPSWSPDGHSIVYAVPTNGQLNIWKVDPDNPSTPVQLTTTTTGTDESPSWSPDGTKIAFDSTRDGTDRIYVMNADGSNPLAVSPATLIASWPAWSPTGSQIVFQGKTGPTTDVDLYLVPADGSKAPVDVHPDPAHNAFAPAWW